MTPHRGPPRQRHCRDGPMAAAAGPPSGAFPPPRAAPVGLPPDVPPGGRLAKADGARVVAPRPHRRVPARKGPPAHGAARAAWSRSCPSTYPPRCPRCAWAQPGGRCVCGRGRRPPTTIPAPAGIPGISPTSLSVSPHGAFLRRFGIRATWHARYRLVCDRLSLPVAPAPLGRRSRPSAPPW